MNNDRLPASLRAEIRVNLFSWGANNKRSFPWRRGLPFWQGLVVECMLQRTRADQVSPVFEQLMSTFPTLKSLRSAKDSDLHAILTPLALQWRIRNVVDLLRVLSNRNGRIKKTIEDLKKLPGVGDYSAAAALTFYGGQKATIIDANTVRVRARIVGEKFGPETRRKSCPRISARLDSHIDSHPRWTVAVNSSL